MDKTRFAQSLISIADELDERGLVEEANELDSIIREVVSEVAIEKEMIKQSQVQQPGAAPGVVNVPPGQPAIGPAPRPATPYERRYVIDVSRYQADPSKQPLLAPAEMRRRSFEINRIDANLANLQKQIYDQKMRKATLLGEAWGSQAYSDYIKQELGPMKAAIQGYQAAQQQRQLSPQMKSYRTWY